MSTLKSIFTGKSLRALLFMWGVVWLPFILCFAFQAPALARAWPDSDGIAMDFIQRGIVWGLAASALSMIVLILPPLWIIYKSGSHNLRHLVRGAVAWLGGLAIAAAILAGGYVAYTGTGNWGQSFGSTLLCGFAVFIIPVLMVTTGYWLAALRPEGKDGSGRGAIAGFCASFILWNLECFIIATGAATMVAG